MAEALQLLLAQVLERGQEELSRGSRAGLGAGGGRGLGVNACVASATPALPRLPPYPTPASGRSEAAPFLQVTAGHRLVALSGEGSRGGGGWALLQGFAARGGSGVVKGALATAGPSARGRLPALFLPHTWLGQVQTLR